MRIPLMLFSLEMAGRVGERLRGIGKYALAVHPGVKYDLRAIGAQIEPESYGAAALLSAFVWSALFACLSYVLLNYRGYEGGPLLAYTIAVAFAFFMMALILHLIYPGIMAKKIATRIDNDLVFALQDLMMQVNSGISLYDAMRNISQSDYGYVSKEFETTVKQIGSGASEREALEAMALRSESEAFRRTLWQMLNALQSGASVKPALKSVIETLLNEQHRTIRNYSASLNFMILIYMLFAAVVPSIGLTLLTILAGFSGIGVTEQTLLLMVGFALMAQLVLIGYINKSRPRVYA